MSVYTVTLPIAGHAVVEVEANTKAEAIEEAMEIVSIDNIDDWEAMPRFSGGNVLYCPTPHEVIVEVEEED